MFEFSVSIWDRLSISLRFNTSSSAVTLENSQVISNTAGNGGGLFATNNNSRFTIIDSTISNNTASFEGGGIYMDGSDTLITMTHSLVHNNEALNGMGGGLLNSGSAFIDNSTISGNNATTPGTARMKHNQDKLWESD